VSDYFDHSPGSAVVRAPLTPLLVVVALVLLTVAVTTSMIAYVNRERAGDWQAHAQALELQKTELEQLVAKRSRELDARTRQLNAAGAQLRRSEGKLKGSESDVRSLEQRQRALAHEKAQLEDEQSAFKEQESALLQVTSLVLSCDQGSAPACAQANQALAAYRARFG